MSEQSEVNSPAELEPGYGNVGSPVTQKANSAVSGMSRGTLGKKPPPKPGPKRSFVAAKVAELQQRIDANESTALPTKPTQRGTTASTAAPSPSAVDKSSKSTNTDFTASDGAQFRSLSSSDDHVYDTAVRVQLDVLQQISEDMAEKFSPTSVSAETMPYAEPDEEEEPIYDEATAVMSSEENLYDEAIVVHSDRLRVMAGTTFEEPEPVYAEPYSFLDDRSATQSSDDDGFLYEEAQPVSITAMPHNNDKALSMAI